MEKNKNCPNNKLIALSIATLILFAVIFKLTSSIGNYSEGIIINKKEDKEKIERWEANHKYNVYSEDKLLKSFDNLEDAKYYADMFADSYITEKGKTEKLWHNVPNYALYQNDKLIDKFQTYNDAVKKAKRYEVSSVYTYTTNALVWSNIYPLEESIILDVPFISQLPELPRGCEVTSLAMLLKYLNIDTNKLKLADEIDKDPTPYQVIDGIKYFGNPSIGFLGSMTDTTKAGYGANHIPIKKLFSTYIGNAAIDITGSEFDCIYYFLNQKAPVWVITNTDLKKLDESEFYTWMTPKGETIKATSKEHSVLITGYDNEYIYINDPLHTTPNLKILKGDFIAAWEQMGKQAVTYIP